MLYFCATPIGNLGDITRRVLQCLKEADLIAVESVKHSRKLLHYYEIRKPLISYREANREHKGREILARLKAGAKIALITDAGMPSISDPGFPLARLLLAENVPFTVLPGPSAVLTALVHSGYPADR
ncbi:MAG: rRNA (cytidine-2'-O-)-methyltransferase, partial [Firmicutes bacterium]|nr:rRNA (cytidine-2'-O-)-methyltransferase [Bacillota bacterium]